MTQKERERIVRKKLIQYNNIKADVELYEGDVIFGTKEMDITGIHGTGISDPSAKKGMQLAEKPREITDGEKWIEAINEGLHELKMTDLKDNIDGNGLHYICTRFYGINRRHRVGTVRIAIECVLSRASVYNKLQTITNVMIFHAAQKGLLK